MITKEELIELSNTKVLSEAITDLEKYLDTCIKQSIAKGYKSVSVTLVNYGDRRDKIITKFGQIHGSLKLKEHQQWLVHETVMNYKRAGYEASFGSQDIGFNEFSLCISLDWSKLV